MLEVYAYIVKKDGNIQNKFRDVHQFVVILNLSNMKNVMMAMRFLMMGVSNVISLVIKIVLIVKWAFVINV